MPDVASVAPVARSVSMRCCSAAIAGRRSLPRVEHVPDRVLELGCERVVVGALGEDLRRLRLVVRTEERERQRRTVGERGRDDRVVGVRVRDLPHLAGAVSGLFVDDVDQDLLEGGRVDVRQLARVDADARRLERAERGLGLLLDRERDDGVARAFVDVDVTGELELARAGGEARQIVVLLRSRLVRRRAAGRRGPTRRRAETRAKLKTRFMTGSAPGWVGPPPMLRRRCSIALTLRNRWIRPHEDSRGQTSREIRSRWALRSADGVGHSLESTDLGLLAALLPRLLVVHCEHTVAGGRAPGARRRAARRRWRTDARCDVASERTCAPRAPRASTERRARGPGGTRDGATTSSCLAPSSSTGGAVLSTVPGWTTDARR